MLNKNEIPGSVLIRLKQAEEYYAAKMSSDFVDDLIDNRLPKVIEEHSDLEVEIINAIETIIYLSAVVEVMKRSIDEFKSLLPIDDYK